MPPRFAYWTIILDGAPTSFRTRERDEIVPLFNQLKAKNPTALLKWFSGGKLWDSPEQAREARELEKVRRFREERARQAREWSPGSSPRPGSGQAGPGAPNAEDPLAEFRRQHGRPADGSDDPSTRQPDQDRHPKVGARRDWSPGPSPRPGSGHAGTGAPRRGKDWRPGGEHRDPRDKYKLPPGEARKRWKERHLGPGNRREERPFEKPFAKPFGKPPGDRTRGDQRFGNKPRGPKPFGDRPDGFGPSKPKAFGQKPFRERPRGPRPFGAKPGGGAFGPKPGGRRPVQGKPRGPRRKG